MKNGRVVVERIESAVLRGNAAGDPHQRRVPVYLPPSYDESADRRYPVVFVLTGFTSRGRALLNDNAWSPSIDDRMDLLISRGCGEMILVMPDCLTRYGGSQYINSTATGRYQDHLVHELVPHVDRTYRTLAGREHRGVIGKSSGGYGALMLGMKHPDTFGAVACHCGDMLFDYCYRGDVPKICTPIHKAGGVDRWLVSFEAARHKRNEDFTVLNIVAMAACYSPNPATKPLGFDLPIDVASGRWRADVWERWIEHDPITLLDRHHDALRTLKMLHVECGIRDEWNLHLGARHFSERLKQFRVPHTHEEFDDGHMNVTYRYDLSLPKLAAALGIGP
jgi:enterochelin esterase family protein